MLALHRTALALLRLMPNGIAPGMVAGLCLGTTLGIVSNQANLLVMGGATGLLGGSVCGAFGALLIGAVGARAGSLLTTFGMVFLGVRSSQHEPALATCVVLCAVAFLLGWFWAERLRQPVAVAGALRWWRTTAWERLGMRDTVRATLAASCESIRSICAEPALERSPLWARALTAALLTLTAIDLFATIGWAGG